MRSLILPCLFKSYIWRVVKEISAFYVRVCLCAHKSWCLIEILQALNEYLVAKLLLGIVAQRFLLSSKYCHCWLIIILYLILVLLPPCGHLKSSSYGTCFQYFPHLTLHFSCYQMLPYLTVTYLIFPCFILPYLTSCCC